MATYTTSRIIIVTVLAVELGAPAQPSAASPEPSPPVFSNESDAAAYAWTQELFSAAGFEEPTVIIEFFDSDEPCGGVRGRTWFDDTATATIAVCATHDNPEVEETWRRRTLLHELAHAWVDQNAGAAATAALMELRDLTEWSARHVNWKTRGAEHAAEIFMWGIQDGDYAVDFRLADTSCAGLAAAYELLTDVAVSCETTSI